MMRQLFLKDPDYPEGLRALPDPPPFLYVRGELPVFTRAFAVVGTRRMSAYGRAVTERFTAALVRAGFAIVSGLALGVDACAHETALREGGATVAVLGSGLNLPYPPRHRDLAERIVAAGGALVSEHPPDMPPLPHHFPLRNRIISGLSRGVLVTEAPQRSGALITARYALEQGRDVFAIPGDLTRGTYAGAHALIRRSEAKLVAAPGDILEEYGLDSAPVLPLSAGVPSAAASAITPLLQALADGPQTADALSMRLKWPVNRLSCELTALELSGAIRRDHDAWILS